MTALECFRQLNKALTTINNTSNNGKTKISLIVSFATKCFLPRATEMSMSDVM